MIASKFDPLKHGLPYRNGSFNVGAVGWKVLCGGLSYAALDYFYTGIAPPQSKKTPASGNPMVEYLYNRQLTAHFYTWHRFLNAWSISQVPGLSDLAGEQDSVADLCKHLHSRPVILCLYGGPTHGHHVVAWACDPAKNQIHLYDSNHPGQKPTITLTDGKWLHSVSNEKWRGWFMDWGHYTDGVKAPPVAFRYCRRCHGLDTFALGAPGGCTNGGGHDINLDFEYFLPLDTGKGQGGWRICGKCKGLYRQTGADVPFCPAGGMHLPQNANPNWQNLSVMTSGAGEPGWRRCSACTSLFWMKTPADLGICASGGAHVPISNETYVVDYRTI